MKENKQRQHFAPKFFLENFKNELFLYYDGEKIQNRNPKKVFAEKSFYGEDNSFIETEFSKHENMAAPL